MTTLQHSVKHSKPKGVEAIGMKIISVNESVPLPAEDDYRMQQPGIKPKFELLHSEGCIGKQVWIKKKPDS